MAVILMVCAAMMSFSAPNTGADPVTATITASNFVLRTPCRVADTRDPGNVWLAGPMTPGPRFHVAVRGRPAPGASQAGDVGCGIPSSATAVLVNIISMDSFADGYLTVGPYSDMPDTKVLNFTAGQTSNVQTWVVLDPVGSGHDMGFETSATSEFVVDIIGYVN